jgi:hypothetical protein
MPAVWIDNFRLETRRSEALEGKKNNIDSFIGKMDVNKENRIIKHLYKNLTAHDEIVTIWIPNLAKGKDINPICW